MSGNVAADARSDSPPVGGAMLRASFIKQLAVCLGYIVFSSGLIRFNKVVMQPGHFPHSLALCAIQMVFCSVFCSAGYLMFPSMYPGMEETRGRRLILLKWFVPIGCCFAVMLFGSNQAYVYCSVTFLQFMKEANVVLVFVSSCLLGLQSFTRLRCLAIAWVVVGTSISVSGEVRFQWTGFVLQGVSQLAEVSRMIMGEIVLGSKKLDPLTYNLFLAPVCLVVLVAANAVGWSEGTLHDLRVWWPYLVANACVAFGLNVMTAAVIKECSAVGFVLTGLLKDIAIVVFSACAFHERVTRQQAVAFVVTVAGVFFWSYTKLYPLALPVRLIERGLCSVLGTDAEKAALLAKDALDQPLPVEKRV